MARTGLGVQLCGKYVLSKEDLGSIHNVECIHLFIPQIFEIDSTKFRDKANKESKDQLHPGSLYFSQKVLELRALTAAYMEQSAYQSKGYKTLIFFPSPYGPHNNTNQGILPL